MRDYVAIADQYIKDVLSGKMVACEHVKQACQRQKDDLRRKKWRWHFDEKKAWRVCFFIEKLTHIKGKWAGKPIQLEPWQIFILTTVFGWFGDEKRRYKTVYIEVARKNAKSTISSGVGIFTLAAEEEGGAEVYSAATTRSQALITWNDAKQMVNRNSALRKRFGLTTSAYSISVDKTASSFKALSRDHGGNLDGLNTHCAIIDELHAHKTRDVFDVLETSTGSRQSPLIWCITTAGSNRAGICFEQHTYTQRILKGVVDDERYFGIIFTIDEGDSWDNENVWIKANPNLGVSVDKDDLRSKCLKAQEMAAAKNNFMTKHLCVWVNADTAWMDMQKWESCGIDNIIDDFYGEPCWVAVDLATKKDISAISIIFKKNDKMFIFGKYYVPSATAEAPGNQHYLGWIEERAMEVTRGNTTDYSVIEDYIRWLQMHFEVQAVGYDSWQANYLATRLLAEGAPMIEVRQIISNMSEPMKLLEAKVLDSQLRHDKNPALTWMISNVVAHLDTRDNIQANKQYPENKIDGAVALIMAMSLAYGEKEPEASVYLERDVIVL